MPIAVVAVLLLLMTAAPSPAADYTFTEVSFPGSNPGSNLGRGINKSHQVVGQYTVGPCCPIALHGFLKTDNAFIPIDVPGAIHTVPHGISNASPPHIVGSWQDNSGLLQRGFVRHPDGTFSTIVLPGGLFTEPHGVNESGQIVGWFADSAGRGHGFLLSGGVFSTIDAPGVLDTFVHGINDSGQMVGYTNAASGARGFLLSAGAFTAINVPGASSRGTVAWGINNAGQIVGIYWDTAGKQHGFVRDADGTYKTVDPPGSTLTELRGINDGGQVVGWFGDAVHLAAIVGTPGGDCTDQVVVNDFSARTTTGLRWLIAQDTLNLATQSNPHTRHVSTGPHGPQAGINFSADVSIKDGAIPVSEIHIRYIQNVTDWNGTLVYQPGPDAVASLLLQPGEAFPFLDKTGQPPPAFYDTDFNETNDTGTDRTVTATDSPAMLGIAITLPDPVRELQSVDVALTLTMFLGCYAEQDGIFRTLSSLDWSTLYSGTLSSGSHPSFTPGPGAGITAQSSVPSQTLPKQIAPIFNEVATIVVDTP
jgi:probable HAF family extracellular repeat protein